MTTSSSPIEEIRTQATTIVQRLKVGVPHTTQDSIKFAVVQDDKTLVLTWPLQYIADSASEALIDALVKEMTHG